MEHAAHWGLSAQGWQTCRNDSSSSPNDPSSTIVRLKPWSWTPQWTSGPSWTQIGPPLRRLCASPVSIPQPDLAAARRAMQNDTARWAPPQGFPSNTTGVQKSSRAPFPVRPPTEAGLPPTVPAERRAAPALTLRPLRSRVPQGEMTAGATASSASFVKGTEVGSAQPPYPPLMPSRTVIKTRSTTADSYFKTETAPSAPIEISQPRNPFSRPATPAATSRKRTRTDPRVRISTRFRPIRPLLPQAPLAPISVAEDGTHISSEPEALAGSAVYSRGSCQLCAQPTIAGAVLCHGCMWSCVASTRCEPTFAYVPPGWAVCRTNRGTWLKNLSIPGEDYDFVTGELPPSTFDGSMDRRYRQGGVHPSGFGWEHSWRPVDSSDPVVFSGSGPCDNNGFSLCEY